MVFRNAGHASNYPNLLPVVGVFLKAGTRRLITLARLFQGRAHRTHTYNYTANITCL